MELTTMQLALVPVILGVVEVLKNVGLSAKYSSLVALILGVVSIGLIETFTGASVIAGLIVGLSASGLYSGFRSVLK